MSSFLDFALANGVTKVTTFAEAKRNLTNPVTDFYRPIREAIARIGREQRDPDEVFAAMMFHVGDERAKRIYPAIIEGHRRFVETVGPMTWAEPVTAALPAGPGVGIAVNPEVGYLLRTSEGPRSHYLKLYLRSEPLSQRRIDLTVALMAVALPVRSDVQLGVLDLRNARVCYLSEKAATPAGWSRLSTFVSVEAAAYAAAWSRV